MIRVLRFLKSVSMRLKTSILLLTCLIYVNVSEGKKVPRYIRERFTNCYREENTSIRNLIEIDGYYELKELYRTCSGIGENRICSDTLRQNIIFYEDGTFLFGFSESFPLSQYGYWGIYSIRGDTLITQYLSNGAFIISLERLAR